MSEKPKRGRPPKPKGQAKGATIHVRVRAAEQTKIKAAAKRAGASVPHPRQHLGAAGRGGTCRLNALGRQSFRRGEREATGAIRLR